MNWCTVVELEPFKHSVQYSEGIFSMGSCFATQMAGQILRLKGNIFSNSHGILYNPISILTALQDVIHQKKYSPQDLCFHNHIHHSFNHHGKFSNVEQDQCLKSINSSINKANQALKQASIVLLTFGNALVYKHKESGQVVGNCHKIPASQFETSLLSQADCVVILKEIVNLLLRDNPKLRVVITLSPIRYKSIGLIASKRAKANLLSAIHDIVAENDKLHYFPAYEIMMDELREYRFYKQDLIHPSEQAVEYIWKRFSNWLFDDRAIKFFDDMEKLRSSFDHSIQFQNHPDSLAFKNAQLKKISMLQQQYPGTLFDNEIAYFNS